METSLWILSKFWRLYAAMIGNEVFLLRYQALVWDFDGTLADTSEGIFYSIRLAFEREGLAVPSAQVMHQFIGPPLGYAFTKLLGLDEQTSDRLILHFRQIYNEEGGILRTELFPGIASTLELLAQKGMPMGVATYKPAHNAQFLLERLGIAPFFQVCCGSHAHVARTKGQLILDVLDVLGAQCTQAALVGDTIYDADGAREAGVGFIAAAYGFGNSDELSRLKHCVGTIRAPEELLALVHEGGL